MGQHGSADCAGTISRAVPETQAEHASLRRALESAPYGNRLNVAARTKGTKGTMGGIMKHKAIKGAIPAVAVITVFGPIGANAGSTAHHAPAMSAPVKAGGGES
jgi:hypothetical protein